METDTIEIKPNPAMFINTDHIWGVGYGPKEYGIYKASRSRKKLKGWQRKSKRK